MRLLITGCSGQLGQEWVHYLDSMKIPFTAYNSKTLDITDPEALESTLDNDAPDVVINCAAYTKVDQAEEEKELALLINHNAVEHLATACRDRDIKLVHFSTDYVFSGESIDREKFPNGYPEQAETRPVNFYGVSKLKGEESIQKTEVDYLILRVSWLCGAYGNNFVKTMLRLAKERESLSVVNDQFGVPTFCTQVVNQTLKLIEQNQRGVFHLGSAGIISWYQFALRIFELSGVDVNVKEVSSNEFKTKAKRPHFSKLNTSKADQILQSDSLHWEAGLKQILKAIN